MHIMTHFIPAYVNKYIIKHFFILFIACAPLCRRTFRIGIFEYQVTVEFQQFSETSLRDGLETA